MRQAAGAAAARTRRRCCNGCRDSVASLTVSMGMRVLSALGAALAAGVLAAVALGQDVVPIQIVAAVEVRPDKAGTPSHPRASGSTLTGRSPRRTSASR